MIDEGTNLKNQRAVKCWDVITKSNILLPMFDTGIDRRYSPRYGLLLYSINLRIFRKSLLCKKTM